MSGTPHENGNPNRNGDPQPNTYGYPDAQGHPHQNPNGEQGTEGYGIDPYAPHDPHAPHDPYAPHAPHVPYARQAEQERPAPPHDPYGQQMPRGWGGGEYDADATGFVQMPSGGLPESMPLAAPGTGQGGYTPPPIDPSEASGPPGGGSAGGAPLTPAASMDPSATGQWVMPFAQPEPSAPEAEGQAERWEEPGRESGHSAAAALGQGAAAALAGSHEARTQRRPLGTGVATDPEQPARNWTGQPTQPTPVSAPSWGSTPDVLPAPQPGQSGPGQAQPGQAQPGQPQPEQPGPAPHSEAPLHPGAPHPAPGTGGPGPMPGHVPEPPPVGRAADHVIQVSPDVSPGQSVIDRMLGQTGAITAPDPAPPVTSGPPAYSAPHPPHAESAATAPHMPSPAHPTPGAPESAEPGARGVPGEPVDSREPVEGAGAGVSAGAGLPATGVPLAGTPTGQPTDEAARSDAAWDDTARADAARAEAAPADVTSTGEAESGPAPSPESALSEAPLSEAAMSESALSEAPLSESALAETARSEAAPGTPPSAAQEPEASRAGGPGAQGEAEAPAPSDAEPLVAGGEPGSGDGDPGSTPEAAEPVRVANDEHPHVSYVLHVNGVDRPVTSAWIGESLLYVLRERLGLAGAKDGCAQGECGACSVQVDGRLVASCLVPAATAAGSEVRTVEGLSRNGAPSDVQCALAESGSVQCGFCVPGLAMTVHDLLEGNHAPSELETRKAISGNLCRCSGYRGVLDAVSTVVSERAAKAEREAAEAESYDGGHGGHSAHSEHSGNAAYGGDSAYAGDGTYGAEGGYAGGGGYGADAARDGNGEGSYGAHIPQQARYPDRGGA